MPSRSVIFTPGRYFSTYKELLSRSNIDEDGKYKKYIKDELKKYQDSGNFTKMLAMSEEYKFYPYNEVWNEFCKRENVPQGEKWLEETDRYEKEVLSKRI